MSVSTALQSVVDMSRLRGEERRVGDVAPTSTAGVASQPADTIELGPLAQSAGAAAELQRVAEIRAQIAAGTYLTDDKLDFVAERLAAVFQNQSTVRPPLSA